MFQHVCAREYETSLCVQASFATRIGSGTLKHDSASDAKKKPHLPTTGGQTCPAGGEAALHRGRRKQKRRQKNQR